VSIAGIKTIEYEHKTMKIHTGLGIKTIEYEHKTMKQLQIYETITISSSLQTPSTFVLQSIEQSCVQFTIKLAHECTSKHCISTLDAPLA
jgi:hypothetical protein